MSFTNLYYKRAVGTPRACYVCYKPTTTVLATANTVDFIYTCDTHLSDRGFATLLGETGDGVGAGGAKKLGLSSEDIAKVKEQWEERQKRKQEKEKEKEKEKGSKDAKKEDKDKDKDDTKPAKAPTPPAAVSNPSPAPPAAHQRYSLHRDVFAMRLADHRRRRQTSQAQALAPMLPSAPRSALPPPSPSQSR
ncbi:VPS4-associated protein 1 [Irpex rosettiformis]|uniref:VPS4-associated protein 1 n=1 Tax=Irpex rosettiformis TaxID=378272 RepID=A0ACB8UDP9_9APHY|nr:VPS4-associated protein 1 [Irpex rosettiformis]